MWKKLGVICIAFISVFGVVHVLNNNLFASNVSTSSQGGGTLTGRIGSFKSGDRVSLSVANGWQIFDESDQSSMRAVSVDALGNMPFYDASHTTEGASYLHNMPVYFANDLSNTLTVNDKLLVVRNPIENTKNNVKSTYLPSVSNFNNCSTRTFPYLCSEMFNDDWTQTMQYFYLSNAVAESASKPFSIGGEYWFGFNIYSYTLDTVAYINSDGVSEYDTTGKGQRGFRPFVRLDSSNVVFSLENSTSTGGGINKIAEPIWSDSYSFSNEAQGNPMKVRVKDNSNSITLDKIKNTINGTSTEITELYANSAFDIEYTYTGSTSNMMISLLASEKNSGKFSFYQQLSVPKVGSNTISVDTSNWPAGNYNVQIVSEVLTDNNSPTTSTSLSGAKALEIKTRPIIADMNIENTPQKDASDNTMNALVKDVNTQDQKQIQTVAAMAPEKDGTVAKIDYKVNYNLITETGNSAFTSLNLRKDSDGNDVDDANGNKIIEANGNLDNGVYKFRIQASDESNNPVFLDGNTRYGIDKNGDKVGDVGYGRISDVQSLAVYPNNTQFSFNQIKKDVNNTPSNVNDDEYYTVNDVNANSYTLGNIVFDGSAKITTLLNEGYKIKNIELVNADGSTNTELQAVSDPSDASIYNIVKNGAVSGGTYILDMNVNFYQSGVNNDAITVSIVKKAQTLRIAKDIMFADPGTADFLTGDYTRYFDSATVANNAYTWTATDKEATNQPNSDVKYCVLNTAKTACDASNESVLKLTDKGDGRVVVNVQAPGTEKKSVTLRAYTQATEGESTIMVSKKDITVNIMPTLQTLSWSGTNIQSDGNNISKNTEETNPTWNLSLKYDSETPANNIYNIDALLKGGTLTDKNIALVTNLVSGTTPNIEYKVIPSNNDDKENIVIANGKLEIKALLKDGFTITAIGKATGNYSATTDVDDPTTPTVNEYSHAILKVAVSDKPKVEFTPDFTNSIIAGSTMANGTVALGTLKITPNTVTDYENYAIASVGKLVEPVADEENPQYDTVASDLFRIDLPTKKLFAKNSSTGLVSGTYKVKVKATKDLSSDEATAKDIQIVVKNATLDVSKIKWQYKDDGIAWKECEGSIDPTDDRNLNSKAISQVFKEEKTFQVQVADKDTSTQISSADSIDYVLKKDSTTGIVEVSKTGTIRVKNAGSTNVVVEAIIKKSGVNDTSVFIPIEIEQATPEVQFVQDDGITSYPLQNASDTSKYKTVEQEYSSNKGIGVFTKGVPTGSKITFTILDKGSSTGNDVLAFKSTDSTNLTCEIAADEYATQRLQKCEAIIKNAQKTINDKGKIILQASSEETNNYKAISLEMPININKAKQTDFDFVSADETYESSQEGIIEPTFIIKDQAHPNVGTGTITLFTTDANGDSDLSSNELRLGNPTSDTSKYTDGIKNYIYNIVVASADTSKQFSIYALKEGDRNYNESNLKSQQITITPEDTSKYRLFFKSYPTAGGGFVPNVEYGHEYFHISAKSNDDEMDPDSTYAFEVIDEFNEYVEVYGTNNGDFKALKAGKIKIKVTRTSGNGVISPSVNGSITIEPKLVKLKVADITKKNGMSVVASDYAFSSASDEFLASDKEKLDIKIFAQDVNGKDMTEFSDGIRIEHNNLPIIASITNQNANDDVLSNYKIMNMDGKTAGIEKGKLIVSEEESKASWYEVQHATDTLLGREGWYNGDVEMVLQAAAGSFDKISNDAKDWKSDKFTITKEGKNTTTIYFRDSNAKTISKPQSKEIKIDRTNPIVKKVTGEKVNDGGVANFINKITFGAFFKPGVEVVMESEDTNTDTSIETSGIASIDYTVFAKNGDTFEEIDTGSATMSETTGKIKLADAGVYRVCVIAKDNAGNASEEYCSELNVKKIDVDIDGDGSLDMNDSNDDGCPDINIVLGKDEEDKWIKLNVDRNKDKLPDLNVDSDGDGIAELNIDTDQDGNPDINLVKISKEMWIPDYCVSNQKEEYCTTQGIKANINVNVSETSYINIDNNGDMKADINITKEGSTIPYINLLLDETIIWNPQKDFTKDEFTYDTMDTLKAELNIDSNHDGLPDMNVDMGGDRKPDINVDVDEDGIPDINIDGDGDGEKDYNIDTDGDGEADEDIIDLDEWNPTIKGDDYGTMDLVTKDELEDGGIKVERPNGKFLANYALRVNNVTESISESDKSGIDSVIETNQEIKQVYNVAMMKGETSIQPNSILKVRIPIIKGLMNPKIVITQKDGSQKVIDAIEEKEYYVYESDYLGNVSIIGDKEDAPIVKDDLDKAEEIKKPSIPTSVKGNYVSGGIGGAGTGDNTNVLLVAFMGLVSGVILLRLYQVRRKS